MRAPTSFSTTTPRGAVAISTPTEPLLSPRAVLLKRASPRLPHTAEGIPVGYYRADLLPNGPISVPTSPTSPHSSVSEGGPGTPDGIPAEDLDLPEDERQAREVSARSELGLIEAQALQSAYVDLNFEQGYPTLPTGEPFWHKLDFEPGLAYGAFQIYLESDLNGPRELSVLAENQELLQLFTLQLKRSSTITKHEALQILNEYSILYCWRARSRAHDLFKEAAYRHIRVRRQMKTEDYHYEKAETLLRKIVEYMETPAFIKEMTPKVALDCLKGLVAIQRVSTGLPAGGPLSQKESPETTEFEMILRQLGQRRATQVQTQDGFGTLDSAQERSLSERLLGDPALARMTQELVIRVTQTRIGENEGRHRGPRGRSNGRVYSEEGTELGESDGEVLDAGDVSFHRGVM